MPGLGNRAGAFYGLIKPKIDYLDWDFENAYMLA